MSNRVICLHNVKPCEICDEIRREKKRETCRRWRRNHPEKVAECSHLYTKANSTKPKYRFNKSKHRAKNKGVDFTLTLEEYTEAISKPCYYCNGVLGTVLTSIGLDRIDSSKGYVPGNILSCCGRCNMIKGETFTVEETKVAVNAVLAFRNAL